MLAETDFFTPDKLTLYGALFLFAVDKVLTILRQRGIDLHEIARESSETYQMVKTILENQNVIANLSKEIGEYVKQGSKEITALYNMHNKQDPDHVYSWYSRYQMMQKQTEILEGIQLQQTAMQSQQKDITTILKQLVKDVAFLRRET